MSAKHGPLLVTAILLSACTLPQILLGQIYTIQTPQAGACHPLVWRFFADATRTIHGSLSTGQGIADLSGLLAADDSFQMTAKDPAGRTATVTGQFTSQVTTITIHGDAAGPGCDGQTFALRLGSYFARAGGGGGGGG